eukprot:TRINITY_DN2783_c0_g1_i1.p1 TRINITY_DN2783_c0_g1~~TRINITY_DN2783_c0_g1_i1.p1  ORF type:complete len:353 (-),score=49.31 TRINITY_DN2783_c0_g1_i1:479-1537(-)
MPPSASTQQAQSEDFREDRPLGVHNGALADLLTRAHQAAAAMLTASSVATAPRSEAEAKMIEKRQLQLEATLCDYFDRLHSNRATRIDSESAEGGLAGIGTAVAPRRRAPSSARPAGKKGDSAKLKSHGRLRSHPPQAQALLGSDRTEKLRTPRSPDCGRDGGPGSGAIEERFAAGPSASVNLTQSPRLTRASKTKGLPERLDEVEEEEHADLGSVEIPSGSEGQRRVRCPRLKEPAACPPLSIARPALNVFLKRRRSGTRKGQKAGNKDRGRFSKMWSVEQLVALEEGVKRHGRKWQLIRRSNPLLNKFSDGQLKDKFRNLIKFGRIDESEVQRGSTLETLRSSDGVQPPE